MAKKIRKTKTTRRTNNIVPEVKPQSSFFSRIKFTESYTSLILGAIVVLIAGILLITFARVNKNSQTSSVKDISEILNQDSNTSSTYTVNVGDDLWSISENIYKDGYRWVEIAKANDLENPGLIYAGNKLIIPKDEPAIVENKNNQKEVVGVNINSKSIIGDTYAVVKGDNLWSIAVRAYGDGFKWPEIAKANNLVNPSLIHSGNVFKIPR